MNSVRVVLAIVALSALPFGSVAAQSRGSSKPKPSTASAIAGDCKDQQAATLSRAADVGHQTPYGLDKKCDTPPGGGGGDNGGGDQPPPTGGYPTGVNEAAGIVYEDLDGNGQYGMFDDLPFAGWTIQLYFDGALVATTTSGPDGKYLFPGLGNSNKLWWVCIVPQPAYVRTQPANGDACSGNGLSHPLDSPFRTQLLTDFGFILP